MELVNKIKTKKLRL